MMLEALRKGAKTWVAAIFIGLLVLSFAVWGIADIFGGFGVQTIAEIGDRKVTAQDYQTAYNNEMRRLAYRFGRRLTTEEAQAFGIEQRVVQRLINMASIDSHASDLRIDVADETIMENLRNDPNFKSSTGQFSPARFRQLLAQAGLSEAAYVAEQRDTLVRQQLAEAFTGEISVPNAFLDAENNYRNESRILSFLTLPMSALGEVTPPDATAVKTYYDEHPGAFTAPEFRQVELLVVSPDTIKDTVEITDEDVRADYDANVDRYTTPERRTIEQIPFPDKVTADKALADITAGKSFADVAKEAGVTESDLALGTKSLKELADQTIAKAAFALKENEVSAPVEGTFTTVLLRVTKIEPGNVKTFDEVKDELRDQLARDKAAGEVQNLYDAIEDERAAGNSLAEIAQKMNVTLRMIKALDRQGRDAEGNEVADLPNRAEFIRGVFEGDIGVESNALEGAEGAFIWFDIAGITQAALKPFDTVRADAEKAALEDKKRRLLRELGDKTLEELRGGKSLEAVATPLELKVTKTGELTRTGTADGLPSAALSQAFAMSIGKFGAAWNDARDGRVLFKLEDIVAAKSPSDDDQKQTSERIATQLGNDLMDQYAAALRTRYDASVNQQALDYAAGRGPAQQPGRGLY